ncbi:unnamed protein product [Cladocopium goreaui]|uniref:Uncharacterized protein n=1 Tax=Cladocopium goreaui TaxID=2562237 RepID=A0A9P1BS74_9DINO|nr:unnamed protein product [Cladocopium goreaui]
MARIHRVFCCFIPLCYFCAHTFVGIANSWTQPARMAAGESLVAREAAVKFTYFPLFAKGPACAFALEHSGIEWQGAFPGDWKSLKATTPFLHLPILETEDAGTIGHELAILNYIGQKSQKMGGAGAKEFAISQQLMCQAEDIYQKLSKLKAGIITGAEADAFWNDVDEQSHNRNFGVKVYLQLLEAFYKSCGVEGGKFTTSGVTVGECKLFATFHILILIKEDILKDYPGLSSFYTRFASEAATQSILKDGGKMPDAFEQCCRNVHIGCEQPRPEEPTSEPFDCRAGVWNFREGWSKTKKDYCCRHHELGCESRPDVVIYPFTNKPVAKCAGVESEISSCVREPCLDLCEPVHCEFSDWSVWSNLGGCFGLCQRERRIIQPNNDCGRPCHGPKVVTKAGGSSCMPDSECELEGDVNCHWDDWSEWSNTCFDVVVDQPCFSSARLGFAGEDPRVLDAGLPGLLRYQNGSVGFDSSDVKAVFQEFSLHDGCRRPLLLSEPPAETRALRRLLAELSFEAAEAPEATLLNSALLAAIACGKSDATVIDIGAGLASVVPLLQGCIQQDCVKEQCFAGHALDINVLDALKAQGVTLPDKTSPDRQAFAGYGCYGSLRLAQDIKESAT